MDPLTGFALFRAGQVVLADAYSRGLDWALHRRNAERLAKDVKKATGHRTGHYYRQWYEREETWTHLVTQGEPAYQALVDSLDEALSKRAWGKPDRSTVEEIVKTTIGLFVSSIEPSEAVAVEGHRSAVRDVAHDAVEATRHERTVEEVRGIAQRLDTAADVPARVQYLPPAARRRLLKASDGAVAVRLLDLVDVPDPKAAVAALVRPIPQWLAGASPSLVLAAAELALAYQVLTATKDLFELAASLGVERGYCTAYLALQQHAEGEEGQALALLEALPAPRGIHANATAAILADDFDRFSELVPSGAAADDPLLASLQLHYLRKTNASTEDLIAFLTESLERQPEAPGLLIALAELHHNRSLRPSATSRAADRARARDLLIDARDLRRRWRGDSAEPVAAACRLALAHGDPHRVIQLGTEPPRGEALAQEAADSGVRHAVGVAYAGLGNIDDAAAAVGAAISDDFQVAILRAGVLGRTRAKPAGVADAYESAWRLAQTELEKRRVWLGASAAGLDPPPGADELAQESPPFRALVVAQVALATGRPGDAVAALRPFPSDELNVTVLADALTEAGLIDEAVEVLRSAADRFNDPAEHLTDAVRILRLAGRSADATQLAAEALRVVPAVETRARAFLHEVGIADVWNAGAWGETVRLLRAWISDQGANPRRRWALAQALNNNSDSEAAWAAVREIPELVPSNPEEARLWMTLAAQHAPGSDTVTRMLELVEQFPEAPEVASTATGWFFLMGDEECGDVHPQVVARFQQLLQEHSVEHDGGPDMTGQFIRISGSAEEMIAQMRPHLERRASLGDEMADRVRNGYPYGIVTLTTDRPYVAVLLQRAVGVLPISTPDPARAAAERSAARAAVTSRSVVIDVSTIAVGFYLRNDWPALRDHFRLKMPSPANYDILRGENELTDTRASGTIYFDTAIGAVRVSDVDPVVRTRLSEHARWIAGELPHVSVRDWPRLLADAHQDRDGEVQALLPWMSSADMAEVLRLPLWADDLGLRTLATGAGVPTFGTVALLEVLHEDGELSDGKLVTLLRTLRQEYAVDLPLDEQWMKLSAAAEDWEAGPACAFFIRPASWAEFPSTMALWEDIVHAAASDNPTKVIPWIVHAAHGLVRAARPGVEHRLVALLAAKGIASSGFDHDVTATATRVAREICAEYGHPNPVPLVLSELHARLAGAVGSEEAARIMVTAGAKLHEEDLAVLRAVVLGIEVPGAPPSTL